MTTTQWVKQFQLELERRDKIDSPPAAKTHSTNSMLFLLITITIIIKITVVDIIIKSVEKEK